MLSCFGRIFYGSQVFLNKLFYVYGIESINLILTYDNLATQRGEATGIRPQSESRLFLSYQDECLSLYKIEKLEWRLGLEYKIQRNKF
jgi:hypothetical protein